MKVRQLVPQLRMTDIEAAIRFYVDQLDFTLAFRYEDFYAGVSLDGYMVHLKLVDAPDPSIVFVEEGQHLHLYIEVEGAVEYAVLLQKRGVTLRSQPQDTDYSHSEFSLTDCEGHVLVFAEAAP